MIKILVFDMTNNDKFPVSISLEGKFSKEGLVKISMQALGLVYAKDICYVEVRDGKGNLTKKISSECQIFLFKKKIFPDLDFNIFHDTFK